MFDHNPTSPTRNTFLCLWPLKSCFVFIQLDILKRLFIDARLKPWKLVQLTTFISSKQTLQKLRQRTMLFNYATLRKKRIHLGKTFNSAHPFPLFDNFVEKNGGDVDEDYHVKRRITCTTRMDSTCMCWLHILWQTIIENFANQLQNTKVLFLSHKTSLAH